MQRFRQWLGLPEQGSPTELPSSEYVDAACDETGNWRGAAVFVHQSADWTVFHDVTGYLASFSAAQWKELAQNDDLVFAGYNDAVPYGQLIVISDGEVKREFLDDQQNPSENVNVGQLPVEAETPIKSWIEVSAFVDDDECGYEAERGHLWLFEEAK